MWLSRVLSRGSVRMRRICCGLRMRMGWDHPFSAYTAPIPNKAGSIRLIDLDVPSSPLPLQVDLFTTTVRRSTFKSNIRRTSSG